MVANVTVWGVLWYVIAGFVIGVIARALMPGKQNMGLISTIVLGVVSALIGGFLWNAIFPSNDGIAWIGSIIVALVLLWIYGLVAGRRGQAARS
jgi:uncharacterized membrane protein YeaQ/YmgE (transglycosylase-associated protein family)